MQSDFLSSLLALPEHSRQKKNTNLQIFHRQRVHWFNSLPNNQLLDWFKLKAFADNKIYITEKLKFVLRKVENKVGKGENVGYQHLILVPQYF